MKRIVRPLSQGFLVIILAIASVSCRKEVDSVAPAQEKTSNRIADGVEVHNGRLVFNDMEAFKAYMEEMHSMSLEEVEAADANDGVLSLRERYQQIDGVGEDATVTTDQLFASGELLFVPDSRFASVLNQDGVFQIGDDIHKITQNMEYIITNDDEEILENSDWSNPNVTQFPIEFTSTIEQPEGGKTGSANNGSTTSQNSNARTGNFWGWKETTKTIDNSENNLPQTSNGRPTRLFGAQWNVQYAVYSSHGVRSKFEYKSRYAGWLDEKASYIKAQGESRATNWYGPIPQTGVNPKTEDSGLRFDDRSNAASTEKTIFWLAGGGMSINLHYSNSYHLAIYRGAWVSFSK